MGFSVKSNNYLTAYAYSLWEKAETKAPLEATKQNIINQLFFHLKLNAPWTRWYYSLVEFLCPSWIGKKVEQALSAYKFDLMLSGKQTTRLHLFSAKEKWFLDQRFTEIFKNILAKVDHRLSLKNKAARWDHKIQKYYGRPHLMIGNYILYRIGKRFPNYKKPINWLKQIKENSIERHCRQTFLNVRDTDIINGLIRYLEKPADLDLSLSKVFAQIGYCVAREKTKAWLTRTQDAIADKVRSIRQRLSYL